MCVCRAHLHHFKIHGLKKKKKKPAALAAVIKQRKHSVVARSGSTWRYPEYQPCGRPPAILALNSACRTRKRIYSDLHQLRDKFDGGRWLCWLTGCSPPYLTCVSLVTMRFSESVWTCLPLCLISPLADDLHLRRGELSVKLQLLFVTSWHLEGVPLRSVQTEC